MRVTRIRNHASSRDAFILCGPERWPRDASEVCRTGAVLQGHASGRFELI
jgi:hypothetical protein